MKRSWFPRGGRIRVGLALAVVLLLGLPLLVGAAGPAGGSGWLEGRAAGACLQSGAVDCSGVLLSYYPNPPESGESVYLNAGVNSAIGNAPGYWGRWYLGQEELGGSVIDEWDGCETIAEFRYFCNGSTQRKQLIIHGADCSSRLGGRDSLIIGVVVVVVLLAVVSRLRKGAAERAARQRAQQAARAYPPAQGAPPAGGSGFCGSCGARLVPGDAFCRSCGRPIQK